MESDDFIAFLSDSDSEAKVAEKDKAKKSSHDHEDTKDSSPGTKRPRIDSKSSLSTKLNNPWLRPVPFYSRKPVERLQQEIRDLVHYLSPTAQEKAARAAATERLSLVVSGLWPEEEATVQPFGSFFTGLFLPSSDIDLVVVLKDPEMDSTDASGAALRKLARAISKAGISTPRTLKVISRARVPIIKYTDAITSYPVDVSINVGSGLEGAKMMARELKNHAALSPLTLLLKHYLSLRGLNEVFSGGLGSFSLMCMLLSFLQLHPYLQCGLIREQDNLGVLLLDFLELYSKHFHYDTVGIRCDTGYFNRSTRTDWEHVGKQGSSVMLSIEDPQSPDNDLARGSFQMGAVRQALEHAFLVLTTRISQCEHRPIHLLSGLVWIPERTLRHRSYIRQTTNI